MGSPTGRVVGPASQRALLTPEAPPFRRVRKSERSDAETDPSPLKSERGISPGRPKSRYQRYRSCPSRPFTPSVYGRHARAAPSRSSWNPSPRTLRLLPRRAETPVLHATG